MCEINPAHTLIMRLECFTSDRKMTPEQFTKEVMERLIHAEIALNADGKFRFHIHEVEPTDVRVAHLEREVMELRKAAMRL